MSTGGAAAADMSERWGWFVALGIGLLALGVVAWVDAMAVSVASAFVIGSSLLAGGVFHVVHAVVAGQWRGVALSVCSGILYAIGGALAMSEPIHGAAMLTLLLMMTIVTGGILRVAAVVRHGRVWVLAMLLLGIPAS